MKNIKKLTLLHSNDLHGDFLAEEIDETLVGGVSMLSGYVSKVRSEEKNVIYAIAGDMFRGSVIDSEYRGLSTIEIMNMLAPDVVTIGNHETDYGMAHLLFIEKCARFPIINANLHITTNGARLFKPYEIKEIDGMRILFIGILTEEVIAQTKNDDLIGALVDIEDAAKEVGRICNAYRSTDIDFTVLLTHIGFEEDKKLANMLKPEWGVDVIIGGHSHTLPEEPAYENGIVIVQAGTGTNQIGRFDIEIDTDNNCIDSYTWKTIPIDETHCPTDKKLEDLIGTYKEKTDAKYQRVVTRFKRELTHPRRIQETELGNMAADAMKESLGLDIMFFAAGSIRLKKLGPILTVKDMTECFPYDDAVLMLQVTAEELKNMLTFMLRDEVWNGAHCEFYQLSEGVRIIYNVKTHEFEEFTFEGRPLDPERLYRIGIQYYHYTNFDDFFHVSLQTIMDRHKPRVLATSGNDVLEEYFSSNSMLDPRVEGRIQVLGVEIKD